MSRKHAWNTPHIGPPKPRTKPSRQKPPETELGRAAADFRNMRERAHMMIREALSQSALTDGEQDVVDRLLRAAAASQPGRAKGGT